MNRYRGFAGEAVELAAPSLRERETESASAVSTLLEARADVHSPSIAIILPARDEQATIANVIRDFARHARDAQIVVVDNGSRDATARVARNALAEAGARGAVLSEPRAGKARAVRRAFAEIDADVFVICDADMTYPAARVHDLVAPIARGIADVVVADRISSGDYRNENKRPFHSFGNELVRRLIKIFFAADLRDVMSGYRAFSAAFVHHYPILVEGFQLETDMTLHALDKRYRVLEIPVEYRDRPPGSRSKLNTFSDGTRVLFTIAQLLRLYRPLFFFAAAAAACAVAGLVAATPVFADWIRFRYIYHVPLAVLAAALELAAVSCLGIGLILDAINHHFKMLFERTTRSPRIDRRSS